MWCRDSLSLKLFRDHYCILMVTYINVFQISMNMASGSGPFRTESQGSTPAPTGPSAAP